jgi:hypothetical protein
MHPIEAIVRARSKVRWLAGSPAAVALLAVVAACSSSSNNAGSDSGGSSSSGKAGVICQYTLMPQPAAGTCSSAGGPIAGANNEHCVVAGVQQVQVTGKCEGISDAAAPAAGDDSSGGGDDSGGGDGSAVDAGDNGECGEPGYGVTNYGTSAADDDCKYDVSYKATSICQKQNVYFTVTTKKRAGADGGPSLSDEAPLIGASVDLEVYSDDCTTIAPNSGQTTVELGNGVYKVGPIQFSKSGKWIVRFHFNACCSDDPVDSPHGHAAFWVNVP